MLASDVLDAADGLDATGEVEAAEADVATPAEDDAAVPDSAGLFKELTEEDNVAELAEVSSEDALAMGDVLWADVCVACDEVDGEFDVTAAAVDAIEMLQLDRR